MPRPLRLAAGAALPGLALLLTLGLRPAAPVRADADASKLPKSYVEKIPGTTVQFEMVLVPGGTFVMGSPATEAGRGADEGPQHPVTLKPFYLGKCEVTWDEFDLYWKTEPDAKPNVPEPPLPEADAITRPTPPYVDETYGHEREKHPALCMTHHAAMEYCRWLSLVTKKGYRLPTEAEWEYAARAGSKTAYFFGDDPAPLDEFAWYKKNSANEDRPRGTTHPTGSKKPNPWGLHDLYGNVTEWCLDHYQKDYSKYPTDKPTLSPVLVPTEKKWSHVARGGSWADDTAKLRSAARRASDKSWMKHDPQRPQSIWWLTKFDVIGFRVARAVDELPELKNLRSKVTKDSD